MKLDRSKHFAEIFGHASARYEQDGRLFGPTGSSLDPNARPAADLIIQTDAVESARMFLLNILKDGALSKATVYKASEENNQAWDSIKDAFVLLNLVKFQFRNTETWKLSETV